MRYSLESGSNYYMYGGVSSCGSLANCVNKYTVNSDGTKGTLDSSLSYNVTSKSWYTGCRNYGAPTWSGLSQSSFTAGLYLQYFSAPIYELPNLKTVKGVATVSLNLAYCEFYFFLSCSVSFLTYACVL